MTSETLSVTFTTCNYIDGYINVQIFTLETCLLDMLYTSTKPRRKAVFLSDERPRKVHHYTYTMQDVHRITEAAGIPGTVHSFTLRFPELSDCFYYTALQSGVPDDGNPQSPIQAWRLPLAPHFQELWAEAYIDQIWALAQSPPDSLISFTPGRMNMHQNSAPLGGTAANISPYVLINPTLPALSPLFVLWDAAYTPVNLDPQSYYVLEFWFTPPDFSYLKRTFIYGDVNDNPCNLSFQGFLGNFQPHSQHLFCIDLYRLPLVDFCGNALDPGTGVYFNLFQVSVSNFADPPAGQPANLLVRPFAIYIATGDFKYLGKRWPFIRPLVPQTSSPALTQYN